MKINLIVIKTKEIETLKDFYCQLGLNFDYHRHGQGVYHYSTNLNGVVFEIYPLPKNVTEPDNTTRLGFEIDNLDAIMIHFRKQGIKIVSEPKETEYGYTAVIQDLDGRKIEISENKLK